MQAVRLKERRTSQGREHFLVDKAKERVLKKEALREDDCELVRPSLLPETVTERLGESFKFQIYEHAD